MVQYNIERVVTMKNGIIIADSSVTQSPSLLNILDQDLYYGDSSDNDTLNSYDTKEYNGRSDSY